MGEGKSKHLKDIIDEYNLDWNSRNYEIGFQQ